MPLAQLQRSTSVSYRAPLFNTYAQRNPIIETVKLPSRETKLPSYTLPPAYETSDELPLYSCDLIREGYLYLKQERLASGERSPDRSWHFYYFILQGTALNIYSSNPHASPVGVPFRSPIQTWNVSQITAKEASQYFKYPHTFRVHHSDGSCLLVRAKDKVIYRAWLKDLQASSLLSLDIDERPIDPY